MIGLVSGTLPVLLLPVLPGAAVSLGLAVVGLLALAGRGVAWRVCSGLCVGCAVALLHGQALLERRLAADCAGLPLAVTGAIASLPRHSLLPDGSGRQRFEFRVRAIAPSRCEGPRLLLLSYYGPAKMMPGDSWTLPVTLQRPWGLANPGSFNLQGWFAQTGIDAVGSVKGAGGVRQPGPPAPASLPNRLRQDIAERIGALPFAPQVRGILAALTVADKSGIDAALWSLLQTFGINHLLVISGLHVGLVAGAGYLLGGLALRCLLLAGLAAPWLPAILALACCLAYSALAGFSVATQRASCMLACFIVASLCGRGSGSANNLLLAAVVVLGINPLAALGSGFWLSFSAVAALLWLSRWQGGRRRWQRLAWTHGFMSLVMLPLGAWWFGGASLVAALANLLMIPLVGMVVVPLALLAVLAAYLLPAAEWGLWQLAAWPLQRLLPLATTLAGQGGDWFYRPLTAPLPVVLLAALGVSLLTLPVSHRTRALAALLVLPLVLPPDPAASALAPGLTRVTVLDVGQGTAVVVRAGSRTLVYDTGGGDPDGSNMARSVLLPYLRAQGVRALDTLVISHPDNDHSAGAAALLAALPVGQVYAGGGLPVPTGGRPCLAGQAWGWPGGPQFQFLSPAPGEVLGSNDSSCVLQLESAGHRLLLPGDIENPRERELVRYWGGSLASSWLLVAHHGSRSSSSWASLKAVGPALAAVSSGYANRFGHPHGDVLARLGQAGAVVYNTARDGALEFDFTAGQPVRVRRYRAAVRRFWM